MSRICADLDAEVAAFRDRSLAETAFPYVFLRRDLRQGPGQPPGGLPGRGDRHRAGRRRAPGGARLRVGDSEDGAFWTAFLRTLKARGLGGTQLVISDAHTGLKAAISAVLLGAAWQRCRVHFMRNVLARVPKGNAEMVAAAIRTIFAQPDAEHVHSQLGVIAGMLALPVPASRSHAPGCRG